MEGLLADSVQLDLGRKLSASIKTLAELLQLWQFGINKIF